MTRRTCTLHTHLFLQILLLFTIAIAPVSAQDVIHEPMPPLRFDPTVSNERISITGSVEGPIAHIQVAQTVRNRSNSIAEGVVLFPIPEGATSTGFQMKTDAGLVVEGEVLQKNRALSVYEEYVRQIRDPAILEYLGRDLYKARIFPLAPGAEATVTLSYDLIVRSDNGVRRLQLPLRTFAGAAAAQGKITAQLDFYAEHEIRPLYSATHELIIDRTLPGVTRVEVNPRVEGSQGQLEILYGSSTREFELDVLSFQPATEDGYFMLLVSPPIVTESNRVIAKDVVVVLDVSGSMEGEKLVQAKKAARYVVDHLHPGDRFNLLAFSTGVSFWDAWMQEFDGASAESAYQWLDRLSASGSTDINASLLEAINLVRSDRQSDDRPKYILFLTDGLPTQGETAPARILSNVTSASEEVPGLRLFTFGVGYDVNTDLLNELGRQVQGKSSYVTPGETIDGVIEQFYAKISSPVLTNIEFDFGSEVVVDDIYPARMPDLFAGEQLVVLGRYHGGTSADIVLRGQINGEVRTYRYASQKLVTRGGDPTIARLWAMRKVGRLLEQIRLYGPNQEIVDAVVDLSLRYGIMTPYTAYLVEEPDSEVRRPVIGESELNDRDGASLDPRTRANSVAMDMAQESAAAPASGAVAVTQSEQREELQTAEYAIGHADVTYLHGKTFIRQDSQTYGITTSADGMLWVDVEYQADMHIEVVLLGSDRYFVLADEMQLSPWLALSSELLIVVDNGQAILITTQTDVSVPNR